MKSVLVLAILFGVVFTLTQGSSLTERETKSLSRCQKKQIYKLLEKIVHYTHVLKDEAYTALQNTYSAAVKCAETFVKDFVACVEDVVIDNVDDMKGKVQTYVATVKDLVNKVIADIEVCEISVKTN